MSFAIQRKDKVKMPNTKLIIQSLEDELSRLTEANSWDDLPKDIRRALQVRIRDVSYSIDKLRGKDGKNAEKTAI